MSNRKRAGVVVVAVAVLVLMFVALRPGDEDLSRPPVAGATPSATPDADSAATAEPERREPPPPPLLRPGKSRTIVVRKGDEVSFRLRSPAREDLHVHGYDITRPVPPGRTITVRFPARLEGIWEIELHRSHDVVGRLEVRP